MIITGGTPPHDDERAHVRIRGAENAPPGLTFGERYIWARLNLGYPVAAQDQPTVDSLRERGLAP